MSFRFSFRQRLIVAAMSAMALVVGSSGCIFWAAAEYSRRLQEAIDALGSVNVRIVNHTNVAARVNLDAGITAPPMPPFGPTDTGMGLVSADTKSVVVAPGGTVTGTIKCGEVIAVTAVTPGENETFYGGWETAFGFYTSSGNIQFSGAGGSAAQDSGFTGDVQSANLARFIRPAVDGLACGTGTLVIEVLTPGTIGTFDPNTGTTTGGTNGTGTVAVE